MNAFDHATESAGSAGRAKPRRAWRWPLIIVGLLSAHVGAMVTAVVIATSDKSFVVLPNYYKRALRWDERKAEVAASEMLGWERTLKIADDASTGGHVVTLQLADSTKRPLDGLTVQLTAAPERRPADVQTVQLQRDGPGTYVGVLRAVEGGAWTFDIDARRGAQRYVATATLWLNEK